MNWNWIALNGFQYIHNFKRIDCRTVCLHLFSFAESKTDKLWSCSWRMFFCCDKNKGGFCVCCSYRHPSVSLERRWARRLASSFWEHLYHSQTPRYKHYLLLCMTSVKTSDEDENWLFSRLGEGLPCVNREEHCNIVFARKKYFDLYDWAIKRVLFCFNIIYCLNLK